jgi:hypothetical protein
MAGETNPALAANAAARKSPLPARKKKVRIAPVRRASKAHHTLMVNEKAEKPKIIVGYRKNAGDWRYPQSNRFVVRSGKFSILIKKKTRRNHSNNFRPSSRSTTLPKQSYSYSDSIDALRSCYS